MNFLERGGHHARIFVRSVDFLDLARFAMPGCRVEITRSWSYQPCDIAVVYGLENPVRSSPQARLRNDVYRRHRGAIVTIESSIFGREFRRRGPVWLDALGIGPLRPRQRHPYFRVGVGGGLGDDADFNIGGSPPDRWHRMQAEFGLTLQPYRTSGTHILVAGQVPRDASLRGLDLCQWLVDTVVAIRARSSRPIVVRLHPSTRWRFAATAKTRLSWIEGVSISPPGRPLINDLRDAWVCVTYSSGLAIDALMAGIPPICMSSASLAWTICSRSIDEIDRPLEPERDRFFHDLAYCQWSEAEMAAGMAWRHIAPAVARRLAAARTHAL